MSFKKQKVSTFFLMKKGIYKHLQTMAQENPKAPQL